MTYEEKLAARAKRSEDPTKIPMHVDPREQRMSGRAHHGNTPFDVPFISQIHGNLWQGGCRDGLVLPTFFKHLVSLYPWEQYAVTHELTSVLTVRMYDSLDQSTEQVDAIASYARVCAEDGPTLIHCQAGLNRSSLIAATVLVKAGMSAEAAIGKIRENRSPACLCNPAFERAVRAL